ncbi:MAG: hypothetical protein QW057_05385 [Candidatus Bathyarchaeia archaeon]
MPLILKVQVEREDLYARLRALFHTLEDRVEDGRLRPRDRLLAAKTLADIVMKAHEVVTAYEVEELEAQIERLQAEETNT